VTGCESQRAFNSLFGVRHAVAANGKRCSATMKDDLQASAAGATMQRARLPALSDAAFCQPEPQLRQCAALSALVKGSKLPAV